MKRVGVFICHCGRNISANINIEKLVKEIREHPGVVHCEDYKYMCSDPGQVMIKEKLNEIHSLLFARTSYNSGYAMERKRSVLFCKVSLTKSFVIPNQFPSCSNFSFSL